MRFPNLRYGDPNLFIYFASSYPKDQRVRLLSRQLRRGESTIRAWLSGEVKIPWWVTEIMRLQRMEHAEMLREMGMRKLKPLLGTVKSATVYDMQPPRLEDPAFPIVKDRDLFTLRRSG
jgi:hypothetical protein